jgi:proteasome accessory factor A
MYRALTEALRRRMPLATARHFKDGSFLSTGGAIWYESERPSSGSGLIEGATPECRGPRQLLAYQRAQDSLFEDAAADESTGRPFSLLKNDRDADDNIYGAQENYEVPIGHGWRLFAWRAGLIALTPLALFSWLNFFILFIAIHIYFVGIAMFWLLLRRRTRSTAAIFGDAELGNPTPAWMEPILLWSIRITNIPLGSALWLHCRLFAFSQTRRHLTSFLVTRSLICGSGRLDQSRRFHLAEKAGSINCMIGFGGFFYDRPLYTMGHFFKRLCMESMLSPRDFCRLFSQRQRLQIGLGDSNMCEVAEYLRIGMTGLILDAIEAGKFQDSPQILRPIRALRRVSANVLLDGKLRCDDGQSASPLDIQTYYYHICRDFVHEHPDSTADAWEILGLWRDTLAALSQFEQDGVLPKSLIGEIDWVTKKYLLDQLGAEASWEQLKKIDIRYHELSPEGYFMKLQQAGLVRRLLDDDDVARARRTPPPDTAASLRGRLIREFAIHRDAVEANWHVVIVRDGRKRRQIELQKSIRRPSRWRNRELRNAAKTLK